MSNLTISNAGISAAISAGNGGPMVKITNFKIGTNAGFTPDPSATDVSGLIYEGVSAQLTYSIANPDSIIYRITLDESVGDFEIGNLGLYLEDGTLFALASLPAVTQKTKANFPVTVGNRKVYDMMLTLSGLANIVDLSILVSNETSLPRVTSQSDLPDALYTPYNAYIVDTHTGYGTSAIAIAVGGRWFYSLYFENPELGWGMYLFPQDMFECEIGETCYYDSVAGKFRKGDGIDMNKGVLGIRGTTNGIIITGRYTHHEDIYTPGGKYYADGGANAGLLTLMQTRQYIGIAYDERTLLVSVGFAIGDLSTHIGSILTLDGGSFEAGVDPGMAVYFRTDTGRFDRALGNDLAKHMMGIRGPSNTLINFGRYTAGSASYTPGALYFVDAASAGNLTTNQTKMFVGVALSTTELLVNPSINRLTFVNTGSEVAGAAPLVKAISGSELQVKSLIPGNGVSFSIGADTITIENLNPTEETGGEINTASNLGSGWGVFAQKVGADLQFKSLTAGTGLALQVTGTDITINLDIEGLIDEDGGYIEGDVTFVNLGRLLLADGTLVRPALAFANDLKMGFYRIGSNRMGFGVNEVKIFEVNAEGIDLDRKRIIKPLITGPSEASVITEAAGAALAVNLSTTSFVSAKLNANMVLTLTGSPPSGQCGSCTLEVRQPTANAYSVTWPNNIKWNRDEPPDLSSESRMDVFVFYTYDGGATFRGFHVGRGITY